MGISRTEGGARVQELSPQSSSLTTTPIFVTRLVFC